MAFNYLRKNALDYDLVQESTEKKNSVGDYNPYSSAETQKAITERDTLKANEPQAWNTDVMSKDKLEAYNNYKNREKFSYDLNGDALYNQYKDQYMNQGKIAMQDAMGQASAMTGGYGNSYSAAVGNETYQNYLGQLNNVVPELYQLALNQYSAEDDKLANVYNMANNEYTSNYGEHRDTMADWQTNLSRADNNVYNTENINLNAWSANANNANSAYDTALNWATNDSNTDYNNQLTNYQQGVSEEQFNRQLSASQASSNQSAKIKEADYYDWGESDWNEYLKGIRSEYGNVEAIAEATRLVEAKEMPRDVFYSQVSKLYQDKFGDPLEGKR